jgi:hypothetical protein
VAVVAAVLLPAISVAAVDGTQVMRAAAVLVAGEPLTVPRVMVMLDPFRVIVDGVAEPVSPKAT